MAHVGRHASVNGKIVEATQASLSVTDRELQYGFGVYESIRITSGKIIYPAEHVERLFFSAQGIELRHSFEIPNVLRWMNELLLIDSLKEATLRILLLGGVKARLFITTTSALSYPTSFYTDGVKTISYHGERFLPRYKTCSLLMNYLALKEAGSHGAFEALLVDSHSQVLEGTRSNVFACEKNILYTADHLKVLEGVTRSKIIEAAKQLGYQVVFEAPSLKDLHRGRYDELFISSTSMGALPINSFDGRLFSPPFTISLQLHTLIRRWEESTLP